MNWIQGACYCGKIQFELKPPTEFVSHCHCEDCRMSHGAAFVTWTGVSKDRFRFLLGDSALKKYESHPGIRWGFCSNCGTSFYYDWDEAPEKVYVTVASLKGTLDKQPDCHGSFEEHVSWLDVCDELPKYLGKSTTPYRLGPTS